MNKLNKSTNQDAHAHNTNIKNSKGPFSKMVTILVLLLILGVSAWGAIKIVKLFPDTVDSLASIADTVYNYDPAEEETELVVKTDRETLNDGEKVILWWDEIKEGTGSYAFSYECKDGITVALKYADKDFFDINCNDAYNLDLTNRIEIRVNSKEERFSELTYKISYFGKNDINEKIRSVNKLSVINPLITDSTDVAEYEDEPTDVTENEDVVVDNTKPDTTDSTQDTVTETKEPVTQEPVYTYEIPTSNPNGHTDLVVSNLKTGFISNAGIFIETNSFTKNTLAAIQFTVHNIGDRTSDSWTFRAELPNDGNYQSNNQAILKPNERATLTVQFPVVSEASLRTVAIYTQTKRDRNTNNNYLEKVITVTQ